LSRFFLRILRRYSVIAENASDISARTAPTAAGTLTLPGWHPPAFSRETNELKRQIELSKTAILSAQNQFEQVVDPTLVDCYIYELNAAQLRYQFLLRRLKKRELQEV